MKRIHPYAIFEDVIKLFIMSCGIVLLVVFFNYSAINVTQKQLFQMVYVTFLNLLCLLVILKVILAVLGRTSKWHYRNNTICSSNLIEIPEKGTEIETYTYNKKVSAVHEAGHAVMSYLKKIDRFDVHVSPISPQTVTVLKQVCAEDVRNIILIYYSGAIAEELLLGNFHVACMLSRDSDFYQATEWIKKYIVMTDPSVSKTLLNEELSARTIEYSKELYQEAKNIISENQNMIEILAKELFKNEFMTTDEIKDLLNPVLGLRV